MSTDNANGRLMGILYDFFQEPIKENFMTLNGYLTYIIIRLYVKPNKSNTIDTSLYYQVVIYFSSILYIILKYHIIGYIYSQEEYLF